MPFARPDSLGRGIGSCSRPIATRSSADSAVEDGECHPYRRPKPPCIAKYSIAPAWATSTAGHPSDGDAPVVDRRRPRNLSVTRGRAARGPRSAEASMPWLGGRDRKDLVEDAQAGNPSGVEQADQKSLLDSSGGAGEPNRARAVVIGASARFYRAPTLARAAATVSKRILPWGRLSGGCPHPAEAGPTPCRSRAPESGRSRARHAGSAAWPAAGRGLSTTRFSTWMRRSARKASKSATVATGGCSACRTTGTAADFDHRHAALEDLPAVLPVAEVGKRDDRLAPRTRSISTTMSSVCRIACSVLATGSRSRTTASSNPASPRLEVALDHADPFFTLASTPRHGRSRLP